MFRKLALGLFAAVSLGAAALAPTSASAFWGGPHYWHPGFGFHRYWGGPRFVVGGPELAVCQSTAETDTPSGANIRLSSR